MSVRLLNAAGLFGLFGKLPSAGDFLRLNLGAAAFVLDAWLERGFAVLEAEDEDFRDGLGAASVWRLAIAPGVAGPQGWTGVMSPSRDASGRAFPCMALAASPALDPEALAPASGWFGAVEAALRRATAGEMTADALCEALEHLGAPRPDPTWDFIVKTRSTPDGAFVDVEGGPHPRDEALNAAFDVAPPAAGAGVWWRRDGARTRVITAVGLPRGAAFAALFHVPSVSAAAAPSAPADAAAEAAPAAAAG